MGADSGYKSFAKHQWKAYPGYILEAWDPNVELGLHIKLRKTPMEGGFKLEQNSFFPEASPAAPAAAFTNRVRENKKPGGRGP